ncbi:MAG: SulP family inorganic anion transporter [Planctomycetota bacterium]|nr:SulP family inorganic anion transporter [Planctomycetota bacterium]
MNPFAHIRSDLPAAIVVFFVAVPLCLGIAVASGAPVESGLIAGIVGGIVVGLISGSPLGVSGPAAGLAVIVLDAINDFGGVEEGFHLFLASVVVAGAVQMLLGFARGGVVGYFFPASVIKGMLAGIGLIIVLKMIPDAFGHIKADGETTWSSLIAMLEDPSPGALIVSGVALAILILWEVVLSKKSKVFKLIQGPLVAVTFDMGYQVLTSRFAPDLALQGKQLVSVPVYDSIAEVKNNLSHPTLAAFGMTKVWVTGFTIAIVASLETLLCVEATDKLDPYKRTTPTNRELVAQGAGNLASGLIGGLPITQVIVRSSANIQSGGRTKLSAIMHGFFILIAVLLAPQILNLVPRAALAAVLFVVGYKLARPATFAQMFKRGSAQFVPFAVTVVGIVGTDLLTGIAIGMAVAIFFILLGHYRNSHFLQIEQSGGGSEPRQVRMRLAEEVSFLNKVALQKELDAIEDGSSLILDASATRQIDYDALEIIEDFEENAGRRGITVERIGNFSPKAQPQP